MVEPLKTGGPLPQGVGDAPTEPKHPGFYQGDDAVEWAKNKIALLQHVSFHLRQQKSPAADPLISANEHEAQMLQHLLEARAK